MSNPLPRVDARHAFLARAAALHVLVDADEITIDEAFARLGLPACDICGLSPCPDPTWCETCRCADARLRRERHR